MIAVCAIICLLAYQNRIVQLKMPFKDHLVQLPSYFRDNQKLNHINEGIIHLEVRELCSSCFLWMCEQACKTEFVQFIWEISTGIKQYMFWKITQQQCWLWNVPNKTQISDLSGHLMHFALQYKVRDCLRWACCSHMYVIRLFYQDWSKYSVWQSTGRQWMDRACFIPSFMHP